MRKGFEGLFGMVRDRLMIDPLSGHIFVFCNGGRTGSKFSTGMGVVSGSAANVWKKGALAGQAKEMKMGRCA